MHHNPRMHILQKIHTSILLDWLVGFHSYSRPWWGEGKTKMCFVSFITKRVFFPLSIGHSIRRTIHAKELTRSLAHD